MKGISQVLFLSFAMGCGASVPPSEPAQPSELAAPQAAPSQHELAAPPAGEPPPPPPEGGEPHKTAPVDAAMHPAKEPPSGDLKDASKGYMPEGPRFPPTLENGVTISGTVSYGERQEGPVEGGRLHLDVLQMNESSKFPILMHSVVLERWGSFSFETPPKLGDVGLVLFLDRNNNGPEPGEPTWNKALKIGDKSIEGIQAVLTDDFKNPPPIGPHEPPRP